MLKSKIKTCETCGKRRVNPDCFFCYFGMTEYEHYLLNYGRINIGRRYQPPEKTLVTIDRQKIIRQLIIPRVNGINQISQKVRPKIPIM